MVHGLRSAPRGRCTVWECTMCGPAHDLLLAGKCRLLLAQLRHRDAEAGPGVHGVRVDIDDSLEGEAGLLIPTGL